MHGKTLGFKFRKWSKNIGSPSYHCQAYYHKINSNFVKWFVILHPLRSMFLLILQRLKVIYKNNYVLLIIGIFLGFKEIYYHTSGFKRNLYFHNLNVFCTSLVIFDNKCHNPNCILTSFYTHYTSNVLFFLCSL